MSSVNKKDYSKAQETTVADFLDWSRVSGSGARPTHPGDIVSDEWLGECKTHTSRGQKVKFEYKVWAKLVDEAASQFKSPAYFSDDGSQFVENCWVMFPVRDLPSDVLVVQIPDANSSFSFDTHQQHQDMKSRLEKATQSSLVYLIRFKSSHLFMSDLYTFKELM